MAMSKKAIENAVNEAYRKHFDCVPVNMMDLGKIMDIGRDAILEGRDLDTAMAAAVTEYRKN